MVSSPGIDVEMLADIGRHYEEISSNPYKPMFNRAVQAPYPPGSVFKLVNGLIGLEEEVVYPGTQYTCRMGYHFGRNKLGCHDHKPTINLEESIMMTNPLAGYSTLDGNLFADGSMSPLYFLKWSEVDLLRAEGVIRGWNVGGGMSAQELYERAIRNAFFEEPIFVMYGCTYADLVEDYLNIEEALPYVNVDPVGSGEDWPSVTKIGVKWNEADDLETKLEKIITQKYIALFPLSTEAWAEMRRTGYPKMFAVLNTDDGDGSINQGDMIRRIPWVPTDPIVVNMVETSGIPALGGPDEQATRLWWDVDAPNF